MEEKELIQQFMAAKEAVVKADEELSSKKAELQAIQMKIVEFLQDRDQVRTGTYEGIGSLSIRSFLTYKVDEENKEKLYDFIEQNGIDGVIKRTIHHKTLDKVLNELIEEGQPLPEYVNQYNITTLQVNKG